MSGHGLRLLDLGERNRWPDLAAIAGAGPRGGEHNWLRWLESASAADEARAAAALAAFSFTTRSETSGSLAAQAKGAIEMSVTYLAPAPSIDPAERLRGIAEGLGFPPILGLNSQSAWTLALAQPARHAEIEAALDQHARDLQRGADDRERARRDALIRGLVPDSELTVEERSLITSTRAENERIAREWEAGRPARTEKLLERILAALEGRRVQ